MKKIEVIKNNKGQFTDARISNKRSVETMSFDEDYYDEIYEILSYAHPAGVVREIKMQITKHEIGSINVPNELFNDFDNK